MTQFDPGPELLCEFAETVPGVLALLTQTGSRAYGTAHEDSDYDYKGVYVAKLDQVLSVSEQPPKTIARSEPHDVVIYELAHFCKLALAANPTVLEILWGDDELMGVLWGDHEHAASRPGAILKGVRRSFLSQRVVQTYGGYAMAQLKKAKAGSGGSRGHGQYVRPKFKLHTLRLLDAGVHAVKTGEILVRHPTPDLLLEQAESLSLDELEATVRMGFTVMDEVVKAGKSPLPPEPDFKAVDAAVFELRMR